MYYSNPANMESEEMFTPPYKTSDLENYTLVLDLWSCSVSDVDLGT